MNYLFSLLAGILQGLTEFLPISSSGHLVIFHELLNFNFVSNLTFDVILHLGTLVALLIYFWREIIKLLKAWFRGLFNFKIKTEEEKIAWLIFLGTLPAVLIGYLFQNIIQLYLHHANIVVLSLIIVAFLFFLVEKYASRKKKIKELNFKHAIWIGLAQAAALIPGVSRSGITIAAGMSYGLKRENAARFSFLLSIPIVFGAGIKKVSELNMSAIGQSDWLVLILGFLCSALIGYLAIKFLLKFLTKHSLRVFAWYRIILAAIVWTILYF